MCSVFMYKSSSLSLYVSGTSTWSDEVTLPIFLHERLQGSEELYVILFLRKLLGYSNKALNISLSYPFLRNHFHFQIYSHECLDV
jgi:hypothetical protein